MAATGLVDNNDNFMRMRVYHVDDAVIAERAALLPVLRRHAAEAARANALHLPRIATVHEKAIKTNFDTLIAEAERSTIALFAKPFDEQWLTSCEQRARTEHAIGLDARYRAALMTTMLAHFSKAIGRRWFWSGARAARLVSVAQCVLQLDSAIAAACHNAIAREAEALETQTKTHDLRAFQIQVEAIRKTIGDVAVAMDQTSQSLGAISRSGAELVNDAYRSADEVARNINCSASATEELSASIAAIGQQAAQSSDLAQKAVRETLQGDQTIELLQRATENIGTTVALISRIAGQTNLLALNATIEAARAGDAGRGFAVVAAEVKALASQTSQATQQVSTLIEQVQTATMRSVGSIAQSGAFISEIAEITQAVTTSVEEQSLATAEIAKSGTEVLNHATRVAAAMRMANGSMQEALHTSSRMAELSRDLLARSHDLDIAADMITKTAGVLPRACGFSLLGADRSR
jgi:methyl-accepting chemotaxis protein